jgi:hypothetical protein
MLAATLASTAADTALKREREQREKVFSYYYLFFRILLHMCLDNSIHVSAATGMFVLIWFYMCPQLLYVSSFCYTCVLILLYMCPHTAVYVSSHCFTCVLILLYVSSHCYVCVLRSSMSASVADTLTYADVC